MDSNEDADGTPPNAAEPNGTNQQSNKEPRLLTATMVESREVDRQRELATERGQNNRPNRSLRTAKKFAPLQEQPWKLELAVEVAWFARSEDKSTEQFPTRKFAARLQDAGVELPEGLTIDAALVQVLRDIKACDRQWYRDNIIAPMDERFAQGHWVPDNLDEANRALDAAASSAARGRSHDSDELQSVRMIVDLGNAAVKLRYEAKVCAGAAALARRIYQLADGPVDSQGLGAILDSIYEDSLTAGAGRGAGANGFVIDVAMDVDSELAQSSLRGTFCRDIARKLKDSALTVVDEDPDEPKKRKGTKTPMARPESC
jgi:hypothetical protein